jgi:hypothetical protein
MVEAVGGSADVNAAAVVTAIMMSRKQNKQWAGSCQKYMVWFLDFC